MKRLIVLTLVILMAGSLGMTYAQAPPDAPDGGMAPPGGFNGPPNKERFHTMMLWKMTESLDLTDVQAAKFFPLFNEHQKRMDVIHEEIAGLMEKLDGYIKAGEDGKIDGIVAQIDKSEDKMLAEKKQFRKDAGKVLDKIQVGKLVHFQHEFPRRFREAMWDVRGARGERGGRGGEGRAPQGKTGRAWAPRMQGTNPGCPNY